MWPILRKMLISTPSPGLRYAGKWGKLRRALGNLPKALFLKCEKTLALLRSLLIEQGEKNERCTKYWNPKFGS